MRRRYLITWAQNATPVHAGFWGALQTYARTHGAEIVVVPGRYKNPTSVFADKDQDWWADAVTPHLAHKRKTLTPTLRVFADISIQPTASRPLSGFEVFMGKSSGIFGHPKRALEVCPTATRTPRVLWSTGACTVRNYTDSKSGRKGAAHHVFGAVVVEIDLDGVYHVRHVTAHPKTGVFTDLDRVYSPSRATKAPRALSLTLGDWHSENKDDDVLGATRALYACVRPKAVVLHDVLDFQARSHHARGMRAAYDHVGGSVAREVTRAAGDLCDVASWGDHTTYVVRSNHDEHLERWLEEADPKRDPLNAAYYHILWAAAYAHRDRKGQWPDLFELECREHGVPASVRFLRRNESLRIAGVEHGFHGDMGANGSRGSPLGYAKLGCKATVGHRHTPYILDGAFGVGVTARLDHGYNLLPSTWLNAHCVLHADGKRQMILIFKGRYRGGKQ